MDVELYNHLDQALQRAFKSIPWTKRPDKSYARVAAESICTYDPNYGSLHGMIYNSSTRDGILALTTDNGFHFIFGEFTGAKSYLFMPAEAGGSAYPFPGGTYGDALAIGIVFIDRIFVIDDCHQPSAVSFLQELARLHHWWIETGRVLPIRCLPVSPVNVAYGFPGVDPGGPAIIACTYAGLEVNSLNGTGAVIDYQSLQDMSVTTDPHGFPQITVEAPGQSLRGTLAWMTHLEAEEYLAPVLAQARAALSQVTPNRVLLQFPRPPPPGLPPLTSQMRFGSWRVFATKDSFPKRNSPRNGLHLLPNSKSALFDFPTNSQIRISDSLRTTAIALIASADNGENIGISSMRLSTPDASRA